MVRLFILAVALAIASGQAHAQFQTRFQTDPPPDLQRWADMLRKSNMPKSTAFLLNRIAAIPRPVMVSFKSCGYVNAQYDPGNDELTFCYELFSDLGERITQKAREGRATPEQTSAALGGAIWFILYHEVGHALFHQLNVPLLGREEDSADQLAVWLAIHRPPPGLDDGVIGALSFFATGSPISWDRLGDEHALDQQRLQNVACWAYGANPVRFGWLPALVHLPEHRQGRCATEWKKIDDAVPRLLGRALKQPAGRT